MVKLRGFQSDDLGALYAISLATGHAGDDAARIYRDPDLVGHIYSAPYALLSPDLALVAVDALGVAGFAVGTRDTTAWEDTLERLWWPGLRARYPASMEAPSDDPSPDQKRIAMIHRPERVPPAIARPYPAHLHLNLLPRAQGRGVGSALLQAWLALAGAPATHVGVNAANARAIGFWRAQAFHALEAPAGRTVWLGRKAG